MAVFVSEIRIYLKSNRVLKFKNISNSVFDCREVARAIAMNGYGYECANGGYVVISSNIIDRVKIVSSRACLYTPKEHPHKGDYDHNMIRVKFKQRV